VSLAIWDHTVLPATRHKQTHLALTPAYEGWYSIYLPWRDGRLSMNMEYCVVPEFQSNITVSMTYDHNRPSSHEKSWC